MFTSDLTDTHTPWPGVPVQSLSQLQSLQRESGAHPRVAPKGGSLTFTLRAVEALLKSYNESHGGTVFAVVQGAGLLHVVPRQARGLSGNLEPVKPIFDTVITIEPKERNAEALIEEVLKKVSIATNTHVVIGSDPANMLKNAKTSIGGSGKTARSILEQWIVESDAPVSWRLVYWPDFKWYALHIMVIDSYDK